MTTALLFLVAVLWISGGVLLDLLLVAWCQNEPSKYRQLKQPAAVYWLAVMLWPFVVVVIIFSE